jgi:hypothetical protein
MTDFWDAVEAHDLRERLRLAESKLAEFEIEWDGDKYVFSPKELS